MSNFIVGVDEVGRGSLVGSVIICAFRSRDDLFELLPFSVKDSKKINQKVLFFSKRFAAKEAFVKSLGTGFAHNINFKDINVSKKRSGKPYLPLSNKLKNILKRKLKLKKVKIFLSLSDEREYSVAYVITQKIK